MESVIGNKLALWTLTVMLGIAFTLTIWRIIATVKDSIRTWERFMWHRVMIETKHWIGVAIVLGITLWWDCREHIRYGHGYWWIDTIACLAIAFWVGLPFWIGWGASETTGNPDTQALCPKCHDKVSKRSKRCPTCGCEFEKEGVSESKFTLNR